MQKTANERANLVDAKLAEMATAQRQIGEHVSGFQANAERNAAIAICNKHSATVAGWHDQTHLGDGAKAVGIFCSSLYLFVFG